MSDSASRPTLLLDSPSLLYRAFFALPATIRDAQGRPVNAVRGYLDMVAHLVRSRLPTTVVHTFDHDWRPAFRVAAYPGYKADRRPDPPDLPPQFTLLHEVLDAAGLPVADAEGYEADDVIGTLATRATPAEPVEIVTGDRDLLQLVRDPAVAVLFTVKGVKDLRHFDEAEVERAYGVPARLYADLATLRGDSSDGLPGIAGVGPKTAATLLTAHGSLDGLRAATDLTPRIQQALHTQSAYLDAMGTVVPVATGVTVRISEQRPPDHDTLQRLAAERALKGSVDRLEAAMALIGHGGPPPQ
jgi:5'-3' exonuclease